MGKVNVTIIDTTGSKEQDATLPDDVPISKIIDKLVEVLYLPVVNTVGAPISYKLLHKGTGRHLPDNLTLAECSVQDGDVLRLIPEITAGESFRVC
ncbi:MAG: EsaB/YukD family protein [Armatimonadota bacterium]|nr:EsaB/YukD family protein [Armatimonadota bacterium]